MYPFLFEIRQPFEFLLTNNKPSVMKYNNVRIIALISASFIIIWYALILFILVAHFIEEFTDGDDDPLFKNLTPHLPLAIILSIVSVIIAWIKNKLGGILIIVSSIALITIGIDDLHLGQWPPILLLFSGVVLLANYYHEKQQQRNGG